MLSCSEYDHIEVICLFHYPIQLTLKSGEMLEGIALDTTSNISREECISVRCASSETTVTQVVLNTISTITVLIENPHVQSLTFT